MRCGAQPMRNRRHRRSSSTIERLRLAIDCMSVETREAMLAAHRTGARTDFLSFARSWDRFTRAQGRPRAATKREVSILVAQLEASVMSASGLELDVAISEHRELVSRHRPRRRRLPDAADPSGEIVARRLRRPSVRRFLGDNLAPKTDRGPLLPVSARG